MLQKTKQDKEAAAKELEEEGKKIMEKNKGKKQRREGEFRSVLKLCRSEKKKKQKQQEQS